MTSLRRSASLLLLLILFGLSHFALAQRAELDTTRVYELDSITKTAERTSAIVARTTSAMSVLSPQSMHRLPSRSIADWLATAPGVSFFSLDGLGYNPQPVVRGFYGGGEAEYVQLQIDGVPIGDGESGLVNWNMVPLHSLASVEILRGGSSALFGDAALGAVINLVTDPDRRGGIVSVTAGTSVPFEAEFSYGGTVASRQFQLFGDYGRIDGFRDNADREIASLGGSLNLLSTDKSKINLSTLHFLSDAAIPGPLFKDLAESTPTETLAYFRFDRVNEGIHTLGVSGNHRVWGEGQLSFRTTGKIRTTDVVETVPLSADFADTQQRDLTDINLSANVQLSTELARFPGRLTAGIDAASGWINTDYSTLLNGTLDDYGTAPPQPASTFVADGSGSRRAAAAYVHYSIEPASRLRLTAGGRFDVLRDSFAPAGAESRNTNHTAFSPKVGANYRFISRRNAVGNLYANVSRSFKAPTFDQLYDQRAIPVPFPPFQIALSSDQLEPQTGTSMEVGLYQRIQPATSDIAAEISLALYEINMKDEIDFDLQQLAYVNIGESRHRGVESSLSLYYREVLNARVGYTHQATTLEFGDNAGNFVKAIPRDVIAGALSFRLHPFSAGVTVQSSQRIFLDDANTIRLPGYTTTAIHVAYDFGSFGLAIDVFNLFDQRFSSTGFPDPAGSDQLFLYPYADRQARLVVDVRLP